MGIIHEGKIKLNVNAAKIVSKDMGVFYNPVMELNRTITILLLNCIEKKNMQIALPLSGSGVRGIRFLKELKKGKIKNISFNDYDTSAINSIKKNLGINKIRKSSKIIISNTDANLFMLNSCGFDYIDLDPFGSPNPFLDSSVTRLSRGGVFGVTATDTSALSGTYFKACVRKYWARPLRNEIMHEIGLRILIRKCQLIGAQFDKALIPIYSYSKDHYMRVFFYCEKGKTKVDGILKQHGMFCDAGPLWIGKMWDEKLADKMYKEYEKEGGCCAELLKFLRIIKDESKINTIGFYDIPSFAKKLSLKDIPKQELLMSALKSKKYKVSLTHFKMNSIKSDIPREELIKLIKKVGKNKRNT